MSRSIDEINVFFKSKWEVPKGESDSFITGCLIRPDGDIVVTDRRSNARVLILTAEGKLQKEIKFPVWSRLTDVTSVDDRTICVSFEDKRLEVISTDTYKTIQVIETEGSVCGVTSDSGNIIWYEYGKGIQMKQKSLDTITSFAKDVPGHYFSYLTKHANSFYQTHGDNQSVTCYSIHGDEIWEFKDITVLKNPRGVAVDNNANVYVASQDGYVVVLTPDGKYKKQILSKEDGLNRTFGIYFDRNRNILLVVNCSGQVFLYNVS